MSLYSGDDDLGHLIDALITGTRAGTIEWRGDRHGTYTYTADSGRVDLAGVEARGFPARMSSGFWHRLVILDAEGNEVDRVEAGLGGGGLGSLDLLALKLNELYALVDERGSSARKVTRGLIAEISGREAS